MAAQEYGRPPPGADQASSADYRQLSLLGHAPTAERLMPGMECWLPGGKFGRSNSEITIGEIYPQISQVTQDDVSYLSLLARKCQCLDSPASFFYFFTSALVTLCSLNFRANVDFPRPGFIGTSLPFRVRQLSSFQE
jgi:hypothetical protein